MNTKKAISIITIKISITKKKFLIKMILSFKLTIINKLIWTLKIFMISKKVSKMSMLLEFLPTFNKLKKSFHPFFIIKWKCQLFKKK